MHRFSKRTKIILALSAVLLALIAGHVYLTYRFYAALDAYTLAGSGHDTAAYIPGASDNTTRRVLNRILSEILMRKLENSERIALAEEGLAALEVSEQEIDAIGSLGENVTKSLTTLESRMILFHASEKSEILALAQRRFDIAADIRGLSYLANHHIAQIFTRIIADGGEVTSLHTADLNRQIPEVEADYDKRANLYQELDSLSAGINKITRDLRWWK